MSKHSSGKHTSVKHANQTGETPQTPAKEKTPDSTRALYKAILILGVVVIILAVTVLGLYYRNLAQSRAEYAALSESVHLEPVATAEPVPTQEPAEETPSAEPTPEPVQIPIDLPYMQSLNSDVDGWIMVEGTDIDYPVLYDTSENYFYLDHTRTGNYSIHGSIFVEDYNSRDFQDFNTIVYGHNSSDKTMFAPLHKFEDEDFFEDNDTITIYTEDSVLTYQIFAAYVRDNEHLMQYYSYDTEEDRQYYIDDIYDHDGFFNYDVEVTPDDRIITLSTCTGWTYTRFLVQGVLISEEPGVCVTE